MVHKDAGNSMENVGIVNPVALSQILGERYLSYALSTITSRSLPDVRDGLKPVHRRLLYAMQQLKLDPTSGFKKCARVVGDVIGKYHPHGDQAVYDALTRLAQDFASRYMLIEGQGNFGNIDGDNAAAMRYTEARLTELAQELLRNLDENTVDFRSNYDGSEEEPVVLPATFPNVLANGASGIAVGMATNIPPHNIGEICDGLLLLIKNQDISVEELVKKIKGPDFPTGGVVIEDFNTLVEVYKTGRGGIRVRARWHVEDLGRKLYQIIITEIPHQVQKGRLIKRIADLIVNKKIPILANVRDESTEDIRVILEPKSRTTEPGVIMEALFKLTELEVRFGVNMNMLDPYGVPRVMSLDQVLKAFIAHREEVVIRRSQHRLEKARQRLEVLDGYLVVYFNLDEIIRIFREDDDPKQTLMSKFNLTELQANAIANMRLRSLRKLEEEEIRQERQDLLKDQEVYTALIHNQEERIGHIKTEILEIKRKFGIKTQIGKRRTTFSDVPIIEGELLEAMVEREPITVICSEKGWVRALKGHNVNTQEVKYKDGDCEKFILQSYTTDKLLVLDSKGKFYAIGCEKLSGGRTQGNPIRVFIDLPTECDIVTFLIFSGDKNSRLLVYSKNGRGFQIKESMVVAQTKSGKQVLNVGDSQVAGCTRIDGDHLAIIGNNRKLLIFAVDRIPEMARGQGVVLQKYREAQVSDIKIFNLEEGLSWKFGSKMRVKTDLFTWQKGRGGVGHQPPTGFPKNNKF